MEGKCWNCGKMNKQQEDGYFWCDCKNVKGGTGGLSYLPNELTQEKTKEEKRKNKQLFLDEEESK